MIDHAAAAQTAMRMISGSTIAGGRPVLLVGKEDDRVATMTALSTITGVPPINLNIELAQALIDAAGSRADPAALIAGFSPATSPLLLDRIQVLMLPQLRTNVLDVLTRVARRRVVCASWPGQFQNNRLRYADLDHPEYLDEDASRAIVLDLSPAKAHTNEV